MNHPLLEQCMCRRMSPLLKKNKKAAGHPLYSNAIVKYIAKHNVNTFICNLGQKTKSENAFRTKFVKHVMCTSICFNTVRPKNCGITRRHFQQSSVLIFAVAVKSIY